METKQVIYNMLTENTGTHFLDSGGANDRHWQRNQSKTIDDFEKEEEIQIIDKNSEYPYLIKSLYHHLIDSCEYLEKDNKDFINWINQNPYSWKDNQDGRCAGSMYDVEEYMSLTYGDDIRTEYTFNYDNNLSQDIQFMTVGDTYDCNIIALAIHNGADARGGLTDYKIFRIDEDYFYNFNEDVEDYLEHYEGVK
jgi:hypothetical protein